MLRDLRWVTLAVTVSRVSSFVTAPLLTNALVPARYGVYRSIFVATGIVLLGQSLSSVGYLVQKRLPEIKTDSERESLVSAVTVVHLLIIFLALIGLYVASALSLFSFISIGLQEVVSSNIVLISVLVLSQGIAHGLFPVLQGLEVFTTYGILRLVRELGILVAIVGLFLTGKLTVVAAITVFALAETVVVFLGAFTLRSALLSRPDFQALANQFRSIALPLVPRSAVKFTGGKIPDVLILAYLGEAIFASWTIIFAFTNVFQLFSKPFSQILIPKISDHVSNDRPLDTLVAKYYKTMALLCAPLVLGGSLVGPDLLRYFFGEGYVVSGATIAIFLFAFGLETVDSLGGSMFIGTGESGRETIRFTLSIVVRVAFVLVGTIIFESLFVIGIGYVLENVVRFAISIRYQRTLVSLPELTVKDVTIYIGVLSSMGIVVLSANPYATNLVTLLAVVLTGAITYFTALLFSGLLSDDEFRLIRQFVGL